MLEKIKNEWELDAKSEKEKYFYFIQEVNILLEGRKCFVIGRKGSGKTAISRNFYLHKDNVAVEFLEFNNFLSDIANKGLKSSHDMKMFWKYIIYCELCTLIEEKKEMPHRDKKDIKTIFPKSKLSDLISRIKITEVAINVPFCSIKGSIDGHKLMPISESVEVMKNIINLLDLHNSYYIVFDRLDGELKDNTLETYMFIITGLVEAVYEIKYELIDSKNAHKICPVAFIRDDLFYNISGSETNKWDDNSIKLMWNEVTIQELLKFKINALSDKHEASTFEDAWSLICTDNSNSNYCFKHICHLTQLRPRDFVQYIKLAAKLAVKDGQKRLNRLYVNMAEKEYSNFLLNELKDEICAFLPNINEVLSLLQELSSEHKHGFTDNDFKKKYEKKYSGNISYVDALKLLFKYNFIGNIRDFNAQCNENDKKNKGYFFHYRNNQLSINTNQNIVIHKGLEKALQIDFFING